MYVVVFFWIKKILISHNSAIAFIILPVTGGWGGLVKNKTIRLLWTATAELSWRSGKPLSLCVFILRVLSEVHTRAAIFETVMSNRFMSREKPRQPRPQGQLVEDSEPNLRLLTPNALTHSPSFPLSGKSQEFVPNSLSSSHVRTAVHLCSSQRDGGKGM